MLLRIYIAPRLGSGLMLSPRESDWSDTTGPWRPRVGKYLLPGEWADTFELRSRRVCLSVVTASDATHAAILADPDILPLTNAVVPDEAALAAQLALPFSSYPLAFRQAAQTVLEGWGINTSWITGTDTLRSVLRAYCKVCRHAGYAVAESPARLAFWTASLDATWSSLPAATRTAMQDWALANAITTTGITTATTLREIQHRIATQYVYPARLLARWGI